MKILTVLALLFCFCFVNGQNELYVLNSCGSPGERVKKLQIPQGNILKRQVSLPEANYKGCGNYINRTYYVRWGTLITDVLSCSGYYYIVGYAHHRGDAPYGDDAPYLFRAKLNSTGEVVWLYEDSLMHGWHFRDYNNSIIALSDSSLLAVGLIPGSMMINPHNYEYEMPIYQRFDRDGNLIFSRLVADTVGRRSGFWPKYVVAEPDMGFSVAGLIGSQTRTYLPDSDFWISDTIYISIISYDSLGMETRRALHYIGGETRNLSVSGLIKLDDGGYVIYGDQKHEPMRRFFALQLDSNLDTVRVKTFGQTEKHIFEENHMLPTQDGGYWFAVNRSDTPTISYSYSPITIYERYYHIGRMDSAFNIIQDTLLLYMFPYDVYGDTFMGAATIRGVDKLSNGDIVFAACNLIGRPTLVFWMDQNLNVYRHRRYWHYHGWYQLRSETFNMRVAPDDGVMLLGVDISWWRGGWFVKTDSLGFSLPNGGDTLMQVGVETYETPEPKAGLIAYPNPVRDDLTIKTTDNTTLPQGILQIFNIQGALLLEQAIPMQQKRQTLKLSHLPPGLYLGRIVGNSGETAVFRFAKE